jgi:hypothetical protein
VIGVLLVTIAICIALFGKLRIAYGWLPLVAGMASPFIPMSSALGAVDVLSATVLALTVRAVTARSTWRSRAVGSAQLTAFLLGLLSFCLLLIFGVRDGSFASALHVTVQYGLATVAFLYALSQDRTIQRTWCLVGLSFVLTSGVVAVFELLFQQNFFSGPGVFHAPLRYGSVRAQGFFPHPIVFGVFGAFAVTLAMSALGRLRLVWCVIAFGFGAFALYSSGSRGPLLAMTVACLLVVLLRASQPRFVRALLVVGGALLTFRVLTLLASPSRSVVGADEAEVSSSYRVALLQIGLERVVQAPLGYGPGELPYGLLSVSSQYGLLDLGRSVDNAYVLTALEFGLPGFCLIFGGLIVALWRGIGVVLVDVRTIPVLGFMSVVLVSGLSVSVLSWPCLVVVMAQVHASLLRDIDALSRADESQPPRYDGLRQVARQFDSRRGGAV